MKNLKKIVFGLLAMLVMVTGVSAASTASCELPANGKTAKTGECVAKLDNGEKFATLNDAFTRVMAIGGKITLYADLGIGDDTTYSGVDVTIDLNGHTILATNATDRLNVDDDASLTITNGTISVNSSDTELFNVDGKLSLNNVKVAVDKAYSNTLFTNNGTLEITSDVTVEDAIAATLVATSAINSTTKLDGTYDVARILIVNSATAGSRDKASTVEVKGSYTTSRQALAITDGIIVTVDADIDVKDDGTPVAIAVVNGAELFVKNGTLTNNKGNGIVVNGTDDTTKLTIENGKVVTKYASGYALVLNDPNATYAISNGTFESGKDVKAAISLGSQMIEVNDDDETHVVEAIKGILTGGKYLNNIIASVVTSYGATVDVSEELVAEGYVVKTEDPYKLVVSATPADEPTDEPSVDEPVVDPSNDGEPAGDETEGKVPSTFDGIASIVTMAISSVSAAGYSIKKIIRK